MARGKQTCRILKEIRRQIAEANDIEFITTECRYKGDCLGTCPKCEAEVRYLEQQLRKRQLAGNAIVLAGLSVGMIAFSGCGNASNQAKDNSVNKDTLQGEPPIELLEDDSVVMVTEGELAMPETTDSTKEAAAIKEVKSTRILAEMPVLGEVEIPDSLKRKAEENKIFGMSGEQFPVFPGGDAALLKFVSDNLRYPEGEECVEGRVVVCFTIDKTGKVRDPEVVRSRLPESFNQEALRVVNTIPKFSPGERDGEPVDARCTLPIIFKQSKDHGTRKADMQNLEGDSSADSRGERH